MNNKNRFDLHPNWDKLSQNEQNKLLEAEIIRDEADNLAKQKGFKDIEDFVNQTDNDLNINVRQIKNLNSEIDDNNAKFQAQEIRQNANTRAAQLLNELVVKVFKQTLIWPSELHHLNWTNRIEKKYIMEGDGEEFIIDLLNGVDTWDATKYIPDAATSPKVIKELALFYEQNQNGTRTLTQGATQYKDRFSVQKWNWTFALKSGILSEFVAERISRLKTKFNTYIADNFIRKITSYARLSANKATAINNAKLKFPLKEGTADNLFDAMHEVQEILLSMKNADNAYLLGTDPDLKAFAQRADLNKTLFLCSEKLYALMNSGIKSQTYHNEFWGLANIIPKENIIPLGKMWDFPNAYQFGTTGSGTNMTLTWTKTTGTINDLAKQSDSKYLSDTDDFIILINLEGIYDLIFLEQTANQEFANNLTSEYFLHVWIQNFINVIASGCVYKNPNLYTLPNSINEALPFEETKTKKGK